MSLKPEKKQRIKQLLDEGVLSVSDIAKKLKIKVSTVESFTGPGETALATRLTHAIDERNALKKQNKELLRENGLFMALKDVIKDKVKPIIPFKQEKVADFDGKIKESVVLHLSDEHADSVIEPHMVGGLEHYNLTIALRRAEVLVDTVLKFTQKTLTNYSFETLYILANGDHVNGDIHDATKHSAYRNSIRNALAVGQMHACMYRDLAPYFKDVKVIYTSGNHGRRTIKKEYHSPWNNWDYLVGETAKAYCQDMKNVEFKIPESYSTCIDIEGYGFCIRHGDDIKSWNGIPWYGVERQTRRLSALHSIKGKPVHYFCYGHFHNLSSQSHLDGEILINGAWPGTSPYAYNSLGVCGKPSQLLHGVHEDIGISWRLPVLLKSENEHLGPTRYHLSLAKEE